MRQRFSTLMALAIGVLVVVAALLFALQQGGTG